jgi:hypothetical protein
MNEIAASRAVMNKTPLSSTAEQNPLARGRKPDPREVLDPKKRTKICGLLALGNGTRMTAEVRQSFDKTEQGRGGHPHDPLLRAPRSPPLSVA